MTNLEYIEIGKTNYLLIHKSGSSTVRANFNNNLSWKQTSDNLWTVIRNPYERFISGLAYDLRILDSNSKKEIEKQIIEYPEKLLSGEDNLQLKWHGITSHTYMQSFYCMNHHIGMFVKLEDLTSFIKIHNGSYISDEENKTTKEEIEYAKSIINRIGDNRIKDLFAMENEWYNRIINSSMCYKWQYGKILEW